MEKLLGDLAIKAADKNIFSPNFFVMLIISFLFGVILYFLHSTYYKESEPIDGSLSRSLVIMTPTLMTIFWFVQYSMPLSVGLLGTLSFVRFRSPIKRAEDITFILLSLVCAIGCAVMQPHVCLALVAILFTYSTIRNRYSRNMVTNNSFAVLTYNTKEDQGMNTIEKIFDKTRCTNYFLISSRSYDGITSFVFNISNLEAHKSQTIVKSLEKDDPSSKVNIFYPSTRLAS
jgi:hypothetical protein